MTTLHEIRCPNCGNFAERLYLAESELTRTQCSNCDYLLVMCSRSGRVVEAYAPGLDQKRLLGKLLVHRPRVEAISA